MSGRFRRPPAGSAEIEDFRLFLPRGQSLDPSD